MAYQVIRYSPNCENEWNAFLKNSRNSTFLFNRNFMDYHADRFEDHSVLVYGDQGEIVACFPANEKDGVIYAHQGLTYGGLVQNEEDKLQKTIQLWSSVLNYYKDVEVQEIIYKHFPSFFNQLLHQDTDYVMFLLGADLFRRDTAFVIDFENPQKIAANYKREAKKAVKAGFHSRFTDEYESFWARLLVPNLEKRFGVEPVHSIQDIRLLKQRFPDEIKIYGVYDSDEKLVGGTVLFDCGHVRHCQYIASTVEARTSGALNLMFIDLVDCSSNDFRKFDFGIANEKDGRVLNDGLANWKQRMGGRAMTHDFYKISTAQSDLLSIV